MISDFFFKTVSHDIDHNTYHWLRPPHIQKNINLDNHEVDIKEYNFTYELEGKQGSNSMSTNPKYFPLLLFTLVILVIDNCI